MTEILVIRHGETPWNVQRRVQGWHDVALNDNGRQQAQALGRHLARLHRAGEQELHALYSSDLTRAKETALLLDESLGLGLTLVEGVRERRYGILEGHPFDRLHEHQPEAAKVWAARDPDGLIEGAETLRQFQQRVVSAINDLALRHQGGRIAVVTHGGAMDIIWRQASGLDLQDPQRAKLLNASINRIRVGQGQWSLVHWGDVGHLDEQSDNDVTV